MQQLVVYQDTVCSLVHIISASKDTVFLNTPVRFPTTDRISYNEPLELRPVFKTNPPLGGSKKDVVQLNTPGGGLPNNYVKYYEYSVVLSDRQCVGLQTSAVNKKT